MDRPSYDPEFRPAVQRGSLTEEAAAQRGNRAALIKRLASTENLPFDLATKVADNDLGIGAARRLAAERRPPAAATGSATGRRRAPAVIVALLVVAAGVIVVLNNGRSAAPSAPTPVIDRPLVTAAPAEAKPAAAPGENGAAPAAPATEDRRDAEGRLTMITGPNPQAVFETFVADWPKDAAPLQPVGVSSEAFASGDMCQAVYRVGPGEKAEKYGFAIRFDKERQAWVAGNGTEPIKTYYLP